MTTTLTTAAIDPALIERVLIHGDLRQLTPQQKVSYYNAVCDSVGLNPLTQPFQYIVLNGKEVLYARREATEQLRQLHSVSVQIMAREVMEDCYIVTARATLPSGRTDENIGAVPIATLKGEARANAMMKAETKAKRRVTLAICGLGMLDETEVASIPGAVVVEPLPVARLQLPLPAPASQPMVVLTPTGENALPLDQHVIKAIKPGNGPAVGIAVTHRGEELYIVKDDVLEIAKGLLESGQPMIGVTATKNKRTFVKEFMSPEAVVDQHAKPKDQSSPEQIAEMLTSDSIPF
jgi:hypothetical protein